MEVKAKIRNLRMSPKKVRLVIDVIRGLDVLEAKKQLKFISKQASRPVLKLINQAVASAENDFQLKVEDLFIKKIVANEGQKLKRWRPRAFGRATPILKRATHLEVVLATKTSSKKKPKSKEKKKKKEGSLKVVSLKEAKKKSTISQKTTFKKVEPEKELKRKMEEKRQIYSRKTLEG